MRRLLSLFLFVLIGITRPVSADESVLSEARAGKVDLEREFSLAVLQIEKGQYGHASETLALIRETGAALGYENLPGFSFQLLRLAAKRYSVEKISPDDLSSIKFLIHHAVKLSPMSPRVSLGASSFSDVLGWRESLGLCFQWLTLLRHSPTMAGALLSDFLLLSLVVFTVALLVVLPVKLCQNASSLMAILAKPFAPQWAGIGSAGLFLLCAILPLLVGLLFAVFVWGVLVGGAILRSHKITLVVGVIILAWGLALPIIGTVGENIRAPLEHALEDEIVGNYSHESNELFRRLIGLTLTDPELILARGSYEARAGDYDAAKADFERVIALSRSRSPIQYSATINLAAVALKRKDFAGAKEILLKAQQGGGDSFELKYNLLQANVALTELSEQANLYKDLLKLDPDRLEIAENTKAETIFVKLPLRSFYWRYLKPPEKLSHEVSQKNPSHPRGLLIPTDSKAAVTVQLWNKIGFPGGQMAMIVTGLAVIAGGFFLRRPRFARVPRDDGGSWLWAIFPGGPWFSRTAMLRGIFLLALVLSSFCVYWDAPIQFSALRAGHGFIRYVVLVLGLVLYGISLAVKLTFDLRRGARG